MAVPRIVMRPPSPRDVKNAFNGLYAPIANAATAAMRETGTAVKLAARADIAAAGFGRRWQNTLRVDVFPRRGVSADPAAFLFHRIPYAGVFEDGATIRGKPLMWLPMKHVPQKIGRRRMTADVFVQETGKRLYRIAGSPPLLAAKLHLPKSQARRRTFRKISLRTLRASSGAVTRSVPLFVGLDVVRLKKRFHIARIARRARDRLAALYQKNFRQ